MSGFVFEDKNRNGMYDASDVRLGQQTVVLTDPSNVKEIQSVTTGPDGSFRLEQLVAGEYRLTLRIPEGFERTVDDSFVVTVGPEAAIPEVQFGMASR